MSNKRNKFLDIELQIKDERRFQVIARIIQKLEGEDREKLSNTAFIFRALYDSDEGLTHDEIIERFSIPRSTLKRFIIRVNNLAKDYSSDYPECQAESPTPRVHILDP